MYERHLALVRRHGGFVSLPRDLVAVPSREEKKLATLFLLF
jgi:hypothetical protein